ncbi:hypothetical protein M2324_003834 [Rhodovulum sulfidophilum]|uniref:PepSY domain-containing protein n=2 Tax=Rhodovulum TaxID=34008 RepID=A0ABS1RLC4_9RHOB|nr:MULTISPECIES: hypothetical protein [Rhodovulum]ANB36464.1 hypothetical protein A6024_00075 [Rhodovulum sulfidophilum]MBL3571887.1 hypothetical protein [Rhodovulum visakhapatnamense]MBL3575589.1 hypothetical protein [Rhodovulum sulfidophilum]MBL3580309.1 hypothetical protein [Rhodovulum visakhapatnamense]MCF4115302.1 hypothetical protein [Rhodovulum sulfidophilum]
MERRPAAIRKSDLTPAFEAAKAAGYDQVSIVVETNDGKRFLITAVAAGDTATPDMTPLEKWRAGRAAS